MALTLVMVLVALSIGITAIWMLYETAFNEQRARLIEVAQSRARMMEAVALFDQDYSSDYPGGPMAATVSQITEAHKNFNGLGETGEFVLARRDADQIVFLLSHRHDDLDKPRPVPFEDHVAEPMRRALSGLSGTIIGLDYRGAMVLAAYEPVAILNLGIVAKIDLVEVRAPFLEAAYVTAGIAFLVITAGVLVFFRLGEPLIQQMRDSEQRFKRFYEQAPLGYQSLDFDGKILDVNQAWMDMLGYSREEAIGRLFEDILSNKELFSGTFSKFKNKGEVLISRYDLVCKDGSIKAVAINGKVGADENNNFLQTHCILTDVTERVRAVDALHKAHEQLEIRVEERTKALMDEIFEREHVEEALRYSEKRFRDLYENAPNVYCSVSIEDASILHFNKEMVRRFGYSSEQLRHLKIFDLYADTDDGIPKARDIFEKLKNGEATLHAEVQMVHKNGEKSWASVSVQPLFDEDGNVLESQFAMIDITETHETRTRLIQVSKLASLGELATGIAHELNQPLNIIRMAAEATSEMLEEGELEHDFLKTRLERISSQVERAATITDHMRMFGRQATENAVPFSPKDTVITAVDFIGEQLKLQNIELKLDLPETCRLVVGHSIQFEQVIVNLLTNARDAIEVKNSDEKERRIKISIKDQLLDEHLTVFIQDTGGGIPQQCMERIFDPFFTTKMIGEGTGLGLSISYGIIADMGGTIIATNVDKGTEFTITLPVA